MMQSLSFHFFYVTLKAEEILYLSKRTEMENRSLVTIADHSKEKIMYLFRNGRRV